MTERIIPSDVRQAFAHHVDTLQRYGVSYDGELFLAEGSKTNGIAWRIYRSHFLVPCHCEDRDRCDRCAGTGQVHTWGHADPPVGSDFLGMTAREAFDELCSRTRTMHDMARALNLPRHETTRDRVEASLSADVTP
jgi:hypothetical protein